ncbi:MAG: hypothetical protein RLZZ435_2430, partial [Cyanobacteriota bacterium]
MNPLQDVFISYGRADSKAFAKNLNDRLVSAGLAVWFDFDDIPLGVDYQKQIDDGIEKADNFVFIISPHSINSSYCGLEVQQAIALGKRIIPILHVEQISKETWQTRNPEGTDEQWAAYTAAGKHDHFANMHPMLRKINWIYCRENQDDVEQAIQDLQGLLQFQKDYVQQHTKLLVSALEWERQHRKTEYLLVGDQCREGLVWLKTRFTDCQAPCKTTDLQSDYITESLKNANNLMTQVFLSYADEDRETMTKIRRSLCREGITVWTNTTDVQTGEDFQAAIHQGILRTDNIVYLLSPASLASSYCQDELTYGFSLNKRIIPILVHPVEDDRLPDILKTLHYIDLTDNEREEDYYLDESQLLRILRTDESYHQTHKILLSQAVKWEEQHQNPTILLRGYNLRQAETWLKTAKSRSQYPPVTLQTTFIEESLRQPPAESLDVFISYSRSDSDFSRRLNDNLQIYGKLTWFDQESVANASADFQTEIYRGIQVSNNFLFVLSPRSVTSPYCADEVEYAASLNKRIITILLHPIDVSNLHPELAKVQWIDFTQSDRDFWDDFNQLIRALDTDREYLQSHTRWSQRSIEWNTKKQSKDLLLRGSELILAQEWLTTADQEKKQPAPTPLQHSFIQESDRQRQNEIKAEKRQKVILRSLLGVMTSVAIVAIGVTMWAFDLKKDAEENQEKSTINEINSLTTSSDAQFKSGQTLNALITALQAGKRFQDSTKLISEQQEELRDKVMSAIHQSLSLGNEINRLEGFDKSVRDIEFSPDGNFLIVVDTRNIVILDINKKDSKSIELPRNSYLQQINFIVNDQDNLEILAIANQNEKIQILRYDLNGKSLKTVEQDLNWKSVQFFKEANTILTSDFKSIELWHPDGIRIAELPQSSEIYDIRLSEDGKIVLGYNQESKKYIFWQIQESISVPKILSLPDEFYVREMTEDHSLIVIGDDQIHLYNLDGKKLFTFAQSNYDSDNGSLDNFLFSPDKQTIAISYSNWRSQEFTVKLWDLQGEFLATLKGHEAWIQDLKFSPDGKFVSSSGADKTVKLWSTEGELVSTFLGHGDYVNTIAFDPTDAGTIVSGSDDATVRFWSVDPSHNQKIVANNIRPNPDGTSFVSITDDSLANRNIEIDSQAKNTTIKLWKSNGDLIATLAENSPGDADAIWSNDGTSLVTREYQANHFNGPIQTWDSQGKLKATLLEKQETNEDEQMTIDVDISPDGQWVVTTVQSATYYGPVTLWSIDGKQQRILIPQTSHLEENFVSISTTFNHFNAIVDRPQDLGKLESIIVTTLTTSGDENSYGPVQIWNTEGELLETLQSKTTLTEQASGDDFVNGGTYLSKNGATIVSAVYSKSSYGPVILWNRETGRIDNLMPKQNLEDGSRFTNWSWPRPIEIQLSANGETILTTFNSANTYGSVDLWDSQGNHLKQLVDSHSKAENFIEGSSQISPDGKTIATSVFDDNAKTYTLNLWNRNGELIKTLADHT